MLSSIAISQPKKISIKTAISILAITCLLVECYYVGEKYGTDVIAAIFGKCMLYSLVAVAILPRRWLKSTSITIIIPITLCFTVASVFELPKHATITAKRFNQDGRQLILAAKAMNGTEVFNKDQIADMQLGMFEDTVVSMNNTKTKISAIALKYSEYSWPCVEKAFDVKVLINKHLRNTHKLKLLEIKKQMIASKTQINKLLFDFGSDVLADEMPVDMRASYFAGIKEGMNVHQKFWNDWFDLESQTLQLLLNIYSYVDKKDGEFYLVDDQIVFDKNSDMEYVSNLWGSLESLAKRQEALENLYQENSQSTLKQLESSLE